MNKEIELNKIYSGVGTCGMTKDRLVSGKLTETDKQHDHAIITDAKGRIYAVSYRSLILI